MKTEIGLQSVPNEFIANIKRACKSNSLEPGVWYVNGSPTDALTLEEARDVQNGKRKSIEWVDLEK